MSAGPCTKDAGHSQGDAIVNIGQPLSTIKDDLRGDDDTHSKEKMLAGEMYNAADPEIQADLLAAGAWLKRYNSTLGDSAEQWHLFLRERLGEVGPERLSVRPFTAITASTSVSEPTPI